MAKDFEYEDMTQKQILRAQLTATLAAGFLANPEHRLGDDWKVDLKPELPLLVEMADDILSLSFCLGYVPPEETP